jgi:serine/threonine protein kinase
LPNQWEKADLIFKQALELDVADRDAYLINHCEGDPALEAQVRHFLKLADKSQQFLEEAPNVPAGSITESLRLAAESDIAQNNIPDELEAGTQLGVYRIVQSIGAGGMGSVYLAERADGQFEHQVAIKVMHKLRGDPQRVDRFLRERQILANLKHPNIAYLIDGGVTDDGLPYLVMEYVEGKDIVEYCEQKTPSLAERLKLFLSICHAVQYAHNKGIIHRDIKPKNIVVNAEGQVRLLDFGIAKLLNTGTEEGLTQAGWAMITPAHASPEQSKGQASSILSDVYQLGLVLYQLIAGRLPVGDSPRPPSMVAGGSRPTDLDQVCLKALSTELEDRYPSAQALAEDVERYIAGKLVNAVQSTFASKGRRFFTQHRFIIGFIAILSVVVLSFGYLAGPDEPNEQLHTGSTQEHSIAVLPFTTIGDETSLSLTSGIHGDLLNRLSGISNLKVIARQSVRQFADTTESPLKIAQKLEVRWLLEGSVQQQGSQIKVLVQLIDPQDATQVWTESYLVELDTANLFAIQGDIAIEIATILNAHLTTDQQQLLMTGPTENMEAYRLYIRGLTLLDMREEAEMRQSLDLFRSATKLDPSFALAWVGLADAISLRIDYGFEMPPGSLDEATAAANRAVELQPKLGEAYGALASIDYLRLDGPGGLRNARLSIELSPTNADLLGRVSWAGIILGEPEEAFKAAQQGVAVNPLTLESFHNLILLLLIRGEPEQALTELRQGTKQRVKWDSYKFFEGLILYELGRYDEALEKLSGLSIPWADEGPLATEALTQAALGNREESRRLLGVMRQRGAHLYLIGLVQLSLGEHEEAWLSFESAQQWGIHSDWPTIAARYLHRGLLGDAVRDPRFIAMLDRIDRTWGLPTSVRAGD